MGFGLEKGKNFTLCPAGTYVARCYLVLDLGTQTDTFQGKPKVAKKVRLGFELPTKLHVFDEAKGPEPFTLSQKFTNTLGDRGKFLPILNQWRGKPMTPEVIAKFTIDKLLGKEAMITVMHKAKQDGSGSSAIISTITQMPEGMTCPPPILTPILYTVDWGRQHATFKLLPEWMQEECAACHEWAPQSAEELQAEADQNTAGAEEGSNEPW